MTQSLQHVYLGLGSVEVGLVLQTEIKAHTLQIISKLQAGGERTGALRENYVRRLKHLQKYVMLLSLAITILYQSFAKNYHNIRY